MQATRLLRRLAVIALTTAGTAAPAAALADDLLDGGKLLLTNGVTTVEGAGGGGLATWATVSGLESTAGVGLSAHATVILLPDYRLQTHGIAIGIRDRLEVSYARQNFNTRKVGAVLGLGEGYMLNQDVFGAKLRLFGDAIYGSPLLPQVSVGVQYKHNLDGPVAHAVGARQGSGTDFTVSATKLILAQSLLVSTTLRLTKANQFGLLGFGGDRGSRRSLQIEGSVAYMLSRRLVVGAEYRTKPDNLAIREDDAKDVFVAWAAARHLTLTAAYVDLGSIATFAGQRGTFLSAQLAF
jgi:hypothetical protein